MHHTAALIQLKRAALSNALATGAHPHTVGMYCGMITLLRLGAGEFDVKLKPAAVALAAMEAADKAKMERRKARRSLKNNQSKQNESNRTRRA